MDTFSKVCDSRQRMICYSIGVVASRLIQLKSEKAGGAHQNLAKLNILQGSIEARFIPSLSAGTKQQIEGSFKMTSDTELQQLALKSEDEIVLLPYDLILREIVDPSKSSAKLELALAVLQEGL